MAEVVEAQQDKPSNPCCSALKKKYSKLVEKYSKLEEIKNKFRDCTTLVQEKYDEIEKQNESLKQELKDLKVQAERLKDEKESESAIRVDIEDEVSALKDEIQLLKQNPSSVSQEADVQIQERLYAAEKEINRLKELLEKERERVDLEKKNSEMEKKKGYEAFKKAERGKRKPNEEINKLKKLLEEERGKVELEKKKAEMEREKAAEALKKAEMGKKKASEEINLLKELQHKEREKASLEKKNAVKEGKEAGEALKKVDAGKDKVSEEVNLLKELLEKERGKANSEKRHAEMERKKADDAIKKLEMEKSKAAKAQMVANIERQRAEENRLLLEKLQKESDAMKSMLGLEISKSQAADKKVETEKKNTIKERQRAELAVAKAEEQQELAEMNLKKAMFEKDRADRLNQKLEEERSKVEKLGLSEPLRSLKLVEAFCDPSVIRRNASPGMMNLGETLNPQWIEKILLEKEQTILREKERADSETKKAKKQKKVAETQKRRADKLSRELVGYELRLEELQKQCQELISYRIFADNSLGRQNSILSESDTVRLLKKQLDLEKMLVRHAKKTTKVEAARNNMLHQEIFHLKKQCIRFQEHLDLLDGSFLHDGEGIHELKKVGGNQIFASEKSCSDWYNRQLISGIDSGLDPQYRVSNRKMLKSSAINSSSASFSDRPLVGSQERGTFSITTFAKPGEDKSNSKPTNPRLSGEARLKYSQNAIVKAEKSIKSPTKANAGDGRVEHCDKRRIVDAVESIENLYSEGQKWHRQVSEKLSLLRGILNGQKDETLKSAEDNLPKNSCRKHVRPSKRRKTSSEGTILVHPFQGSGESKSTIDLDTPDLGASTHASPLLRSTSPDFNEMAFNDYMKLLDLGNSDDERSYRKAVATPLSPTLPEIQCCGDDVHGVDNPEMLVLKSSQEGLSNGKDSLLPTTNFVVSERQKNGPNLVLCDPVSSQLQTKEDSVDFRTMDSLQASDAHFCQIRASSEKFRIPDFSGSQNKELVIQCESKIASTPSDVKFLVVFSTNEDSHIISRILQSMNSCMPQCYLLQSADVFLQSVVVILQKAVDLSMKEKACVFFSVILHQISEVGAKISKDASDDLILSLISSTQQIHAALSDLVIRRTFMESFGLFELLDLIEDFLLKRKIWVSGDVSAESQVLRGSKLNLVLNGHPVILSERAASTHLLVVGASLFASLCSTIDCIAFVCEISCNIFTMQKIDPVVVLAILHAFAHICGSKYFIIPQYLGAMTLIKSVVMFLEKQILSSNSTSFSPLSGETVPKLWFCTNCPFSEGAVSTEAVALLLLQKLQNCVQSLSWPQNVLYSVNSLVSKAWSLQERVIEVSVLGKATTLNAKSNEILCEFFDILSLVEILASLMKWEWISDNFIGQLCELLESCLMEGLSAAIVTLLGQLGRLGIDASGYEDTGVKKIRGRLSAILCRITFGKLSLPVQFALITALLGLTPIKFGDILESKVDNASVMNYSIPADFLRKWFLLLSDEQQSFLRLHQAADEKNCRTG